MRIFIIGVNGFIGNAFLGRILRDTDWNVTGIDLEKDRLGPKMLGDPRFEFHVGDIGINKEWLELQIKRADVIVPLAAIAVPSIYLTDPLAVFELNFMENLAIVRLAVKHQKHLLIPSSSEVYGLCADPVFDEETSSLSLGPINKHRWIYSCSKQLMDRVVHAYGLQRGLEYTIFRPFNWIGPMLDRLHEPKHGGSRVLTQFISCVAFNQAIKLVDGGAQKRCFLFIDDGIDALVRMIQRREGNARRRIFNVGHPDNECSIRELAEMTVRLYAAHPRSKKHPFTAGLKTVSSTEHYGEGYQDVTWRRPSIANAEKLLEWRPKVRLEEAVRLTIESFLKDLPG